MRAIARAKCQGWLGSTVPESHRTSNHTTSTPIPQSDANAFGVYKHLETEKSIDLPEQMCMV